MFHLTVIFTNFNVKSYSELACIGLSCAPVKLLMQNTGVIILRLRAVVLNAIWCNLCKKKRGV